MVGSIDGGDNFICLLHIGCLETLELPFRSLIFHEETSIALLRCILIENSKYKLNLVHGTTLKLVLSLNLL